MPALSHIGLGLAAKRAAPRVPVLISVVAALALDILAGIFWLAGVIGIVPGDTLSWSHSLPLAVLWSVGLAGLSIYIYRNRRASLVIGLLVFSHWILDFMMWSPNSSLLYGGGPEVGLNLGNPIGIAIAFEVGVLILGFVIFLRSRVLNQRDSSEKVN